MFCNGFPVQKGPGLQIQFLLMLSIAEHCSHLMGGMWPIQEAKAQSWRRKMSFPFSLHYSVYGCTSLLLQEQNSDDFTLANGPALWVNHLCSTTETKHVCTWHTWLPCPLVQTPNPSPKAADLSLRHSFALHALPTCYKDYLSFYQNKARTQD